MVLHPPMTPERREFPSRLIAVTKTRKGGQLITTTQHAKHHVQQQAGRPLGLGRPANAVIEALAPVVPMKPTGRRRAPRKEFPFPALARAQLDEIQQVLEEETGLRYDSGEVLAIVLGLAYDNLEFLVRRYAPTNHHNIRKTRSDAQ